MAKKRCDNCKFWVMEERESGLCYRYPPTMLGAINDSVPWAEYPRVSGDDWCGEFVPVRGGR